MLQRPISGKRIAMAAVVVLTMAAFVVLGAIHIEHSWVSGLVHEVTAFRIRLWTYTVEKGHPPSKLADVIPSVGRHSKLFFGTQQGMRCWLQFTASSKPGGAVVQIRCGAPLFAEYRIAGNGMIVSEKWYSWLWLRGALQKKGDYPRLVSLLNAEM